MTSIHSEVEKALEGTLPYSFFYHTRGDKVEAITVAVTPEQYDRLDVDVYGRIAAKLGALLVITERKHDDAALEKSVFAETYGVGQVESDLFENISASELLTTVIPNGTQHFAVGTVDSAYATFLNAERVSSQRHDFEGYSIIDFETTGFKADATDRAIEVAIVHLSPAGEFQGKWDTLINPNRDTGAEHIHHISNEMVRFAPDIKDVIVGIGALIQNRKLLAHNKKFDHTFVVEEFKKGGLESPVELHNMMCSMLWSQRYAGGVMKHRLVDCCEREGITIQNAHRAIGDTEATAKLVARYLNKHGEKYPEEHEVVPSSLLYEGGMDQITNFFTREDALKKMR